MTTGRDGAGPIPPALCLTLDADSTTTLASKKFALLNADVTILAQPSKMAPHIPVMKQIISTPPAVKPDQADIKAAATEGVGRAGRGEGSAVHVAVLLRRP